MTESPPRPIPLIQERYRVEAKLGDTRLATVYRAVDERLRRNVLVHLLRKDLTNNPTLRDRFLAESRDAARVTHPALLEVFDSGEAVGRPFLVTEYVDGRSLREVGAITPDEALLYLRQAAGAVAACQALGLPHPPISSVNLIQVDTGRIKLVENWCFPQEAAPLDLAHYRAPERIRGEAPSPATAVYALGVLLFELISGTRPFTGAGSQQVALAHLHSAVPSLATTRPGLYLPSLDRLIARATEPQPAQRIRDAASLARAIDDTRQSLLGTTQPLQMPSPSTSQLGNRLRQAAATLIPPTSRLPVLPANADAPTRQTHRDRIRYGWQRTIQAWLVLLLICSIVFGGSWWLANQVTRQLQAVEQPQITLPTLPTLPEANWRDWLRSLIPESMREVVPEPEITLVVNASGLNLRPSPGIDNTPITELAGGTRVVLLEPPVILADGSQWVRVRSTSDGQEGWVALEFLRPES